MPTTPIDYHISQGDFGKVMKFTLLGADGQPVDLTTVTTVKFYLGDPRTPEDLIIDGAACVPDPDQTANKGVARYTWAEADTAVAGYFEGVVKARWGSTQRLTHPTDPRVRVMIKKELGT